MDVWKKLNTLPNCIDTELHMEFSNEKKKPAVLLEKWVEKGFMFIPEGCPDFRVFPLLHYRMERGEVVKLGYRAGHS